MNFKVKMYVSLLLIEKLTAIVMRRYTYYNHRYYLYWDIQVHWEGGGVGKVVIRPDIEFSWRSQRPILLYNK